MIEHVAYAFEQDTIIRNINLAIQIQIVFSLIPRFTGVKLFYKFKKERSVSDINVPTVIKVSRRRRVRL